MLTTFFGLGAYVSARECFPRLARQAGAKLRTGKTVPFDIEAVPGVHTVAGAAQMENGAAGLQGLDEGELHGSERDDEARWRLVPKPVLTETAGSWPATAEVADPLGYALQILFQLCCAMALLVDLVLWLILFPEAIAAHRTAQILNFISYNMHGLNAVSMAGEFCLNSMRFPWFRFSYMVLWSVGFVLFSWYRHIYNHWWPYPFLDYADPYAPLWYVGLLAFHFVCFTVWVELSLLKLQRLPCSLDWPVKLLPGGPSRYSHTLTGTATQEL
eukprot:SM000014S00338  [mRNA]  locus=s14:742159:744047:- [translate_table: standard]